MGDLIKQLRRMSNRSRLTSRERADCLKAAAEIERLRATLALVRTAPREEHTPEQLAEQLGVSALSAQGKKPADLESGAALRQYNAIEDARHAFHRNGAKGGEDGDD